MVEVMNRLTSMKTYLLGGGRQGRLLYLPGMGSKGGGFRMAGRVAHEMIRPHAKTGSYHRASPVHVPADAHARCHIFDCATRYIAEDGHGDVVRPSRWCLHPSVIMLGGRAGGIHGGRAESPLR
jgi:hypothetical protein